ncbi:MAG: AMP-binding protein [Actinobacteria bacterium]|nr:AMP-binding protein [Actinomycetota bacterium]
MADLMESGRTEDLKAPVGELSIADRRTIPRILTAAAAADPDRELLVFDPLDGESTRFGRADVLARTLGIADRLRGVGVGPGDAIHIHLANRPEFLFTWFAAAVLGARMIPTNVVSSPTEVAYIIGHSGASVSVTDRELAGAVREAARIAGRRLPVLVCEDDLADAVASDLTLPALGDPDADLAVMYTSGTTARPKGVRVTQANYIYAGETVASALRLRSDDRFLVVLPLYHANAQYYSVMGTLVSGGTVILAGRFSATRYAKLAVRHEATVGSLFAAPIRMILRQEPEADWREHRLREVVFAQNLTDAEIERWNEVIGAPLLQLYGMTETIGPPLMNPVEGSRRHDALGRPTLGYSCRILREDGSSVTVGEPGELEVKGVPGVSIMPGYLDDRDSTTAVLKDGWLSTGDLVEVAEDGLLNFVGRSKDMIKRGGENVAAGEVELVLQKHPAVADAAVVGVPDEIRDEQIVAFVVPVAAGAVDEATLIRWCQERLAKFRVPSIVRFLPDLPRTAVGKIQKNRLRAAWEDEAGAER